MDERTVNEIPLDMDDLFGGDTIVTLVIKDWPVRFHYREKDSETDLGYQRRAAAIKNNNGKVEATDRSLTSDLWLFDQLCMRVEVGATGQSPDGATTWTAVEDFKRKISPDIKRLANFEYNRRVQRESDDGKN